MKQPEGKPPGCDWLFYCNGFGQVAGLIHVAAPVQGHIVGKDLQRDQAQAGLQHRMDLGNGNAVIRHGQLGRKGLGGRHGDFQSRGCIHTNTGRVLAPILQFGEALQQNRRRLAAARISYDSAHNYVLLRDFSIYLSFYIMSVYFSTIIRKKLICDESHHRSKKFGLSERRTFKSASCSNVINWAPLSASIAAPWLPSAKQNSGL